MLDVDFVIQSRLKSSRLPAKAGILMPCGNNCVKATILRCELIADTLPIKSRIFLACPEKEQKIFNKLIEGTNAKVVVGDENNVLKRFRKITLENNILNFVRITADNPYFCKDVIEFLLEFNYKKVNCVSLYHQKKIPNGSVVSLMSRDYLEKINNFGCKISQEHLVTSPKNEINQLIKIPRIPEHLSWNEGRFCLDDLQDYFYLHDNPKIETLLNVKDMKKHLSKRKNVEIY